MNIVEIYKKYPEHRDCLDHLEHVRWNGTPVCPYCNSTNATPMKKEHRHHCNNCNTSFSVTVRTIFHKTKLDLQKWFLGISIILNAQSYMRVPRSARLNATDLCLFPASDSEMKRIGKEYCPPHTKQTDFENLIRHATGEQYSFLYISTLADPDKRFRRKFDAYLELPGKQTNVGGTGTKRRERAERFEDDDEPDRKRGRAF